MRWQRGGNKATKRIHQLHSIFWRQQQRILWVDHPLCLQWKAPPAPKTETMFQLPTIHFSGRFRGMRTLSFWWKKQMPTAWGKKISHAWWCSTAFWTRPSKWSLGQSTLASFNDIIESRKPQRTVNLIKGKGNKKKNCLPQSNNGKRIKFPTTKGSDKEKYWENASDVQNPIIWCNIAGSAHQLATIAATIQVTYLRHASKANMQDQRKRLRTLHTL